MRFLNVFKFVCFAIAQSDDQKCVPSTEIDRGSGGPDLQLIRQGLNFSNIVEVNEFPYENGKYRTYELYGRISPYNSDLYANVPIGSWFHQHTLTSELIAGYVLWVKSAAGKTGWHVVTLTA